MQRLASSLACVVGSLFAAPLASAQWTSDTATNTPLADRPGEQNQAKVRALCDGSAYVSWYDNSSGGYDPTLQRLDPQGNELWPHNGLQLADTTFSSTEDYDLRIDAAGNAVVAFRDNSIGTTKVTIKVISPAGSTLWSRSITASDNAHNPKCAILSDGSIAAVWTTNNSPASFAMQRLDSAGNEIWPAPITCSEASRYVAVSDVQASTNASFIVHFIRATGSNPILSSKHLYSQKFDSTGAPQWIGTALPIANAGNPVIIFNATSIQNGTFPNFLPDGQGGAIYAWYETGGSRNAYVQHQNADGTFRFPAGGVPSTGATPNIMRISASVAYDAERDEIFLAWSDSTISPQNAWGIRAQKFDSTGARLWGDAGATLIALNANQTSFVRCVAAAGGCMVFGFDARSATTGVVVAGRFDPNGLPAWPAQPLLACSTISGKARLDAAGTIDGGALLAWGDARSDANNIMGQRVNADGTFGNPICIADLDNGTSTGTPDGGVTIDDLLYYLLIFEAGSIQADIDDGSATATRDCGVTIDDLLYYLFRFETGC